MKTYWYLVVGEDIWEKMVAKNLSPNAQTPRVGTWCLIFHIRESGKTPLRQRQQPGDASVTFKTLQQHPTSGTAGCNYFGKTRILM